MFGGECPPRCCAWVVGLVRGRKFYDFFKLLGYGYCSFRFRCIKMTTGGGSAYMVSTHAGIVPSLLPAMGKTLKLFRLGGRLVDIFIVFEGIKAGVRKLLFCMYFM